MPTQIRIPDDFKLVMNEVLIEVPTKLPDNTDVYKSDLDITTRQETNRVCY